MIAHRIDWWRLQEIVMARALPNPIPALAALDELELGMLVYSSRKATTGSTRVALSAGT